MLGFGLLDFLGSLSAAFDHGEVANTEQLLLLLLRERDLLLHPEAAFLGFQHVLDDIGLLPNLEFLLGLYGPSRCRFALVEFPHQHLAGDAEGGDVQVLVQDLVQVLEGLLAVNEVRRRVFIRIFRIVPVPLHHNDDIGRGHSFAVAVDWLDLLDQVEMPEELRLLVPDPEDG